jgi:hypothetical protein
LNSVDLTHGWLESDWFQTFTLEHQSWFQDVPFTFNLRHYSEAHRYLVSGAPLAAGLVDAVRVMRHEAIRFVVSTQSPLTVGASPSLTFLNYFSTIS